MADSIHASLNTRGKPTTSDGRVLKSTVQRHTNDVRCGRAVGGGVPTVRADVRGISAVGALSTSANNGQWINRMVKRDRQDRRVTRSRIAPEALIALRLERGLSAVAA